MVLLEPCLRPLLAALLTLLGLALFARGFLLTRLELPQRSACADAAHLPPPPHGAPSAPCWAPPRHDRLVLLVIDAWRHDFAAPAGAAACAGAHAHHCNRMPKLQRALAARPRHARLYRAAVDAPTVTMQRVKALATGGLPTFMDIGASFGSGRVSEDSWLAQACSGSSGGGGDGGGAPCYLLGDDTWDSLFPAVWTRTPGERVRHAPFSTFDTKDLDSGDAQLAAALLPALQALAAGGNATAGPAQQQPPWRLLLAHAPGVDHVGHTHHANHPAMARKLAEMDELVEGVVAALEAAPGRTLLVVVGDHGMTEDGNHGGSTAEEAGAALLVASFGAPLLSPAAAAAATDGAPVSQLDLVPSIALALGLPIPYNSLGSVMADWEWGGAQGGAHAALLVAFAQQRFMRSYAEALGGEGSRGGGHFVRLASSLSQRYQALLRGYQALEGVAGGAGASASAWLELTAALRQFSSDVAAACRAQWTQFSQGHMALGLALLLAALLMTLHHGLGGGECVRGGWKGSQYNSISSSSSSSSSPPTPAPSAAAAAVDASKERRPFPTSQLARALPLLATLVCVARVWALFTDTYISAEPQLVLLLQGVLVLPMGACATHALWRASPLLSRKAAAMLPAAAALLFMAAAAATAAPATGWLHGAFLAHMQRLPAPAAPAAPLPALGAGATAPILLPVDASEAAARSYAGASMATLAALLLAPLLASQALHWLTLAVGELGGCALSTEGARKAHAHTHALHARYHVLHACAALAAMCLYLHWQGEALFPGNVWPRSVCGGGGSSGGGGGEEGLLLLEGDDSSSSSSMCDWLLPPPRQALPRAVLLLTALLQVLHACIAPSTPPAALAGLLRLSPAHIPILRLLSATNAAHMTTFTLLPAACLLLGPWSPPILLGLFLQAQCLQALVLAGSWGAPALQVWGAGEGSSSSSSSSSSVQLARLLGPWHGLIALHPHQAQPLLPLHAIAVLCGLFATHAWGGTGHTAQFSALAYNSGFLWSEAFSVAGSGALLAGNTFGVSHGVVAGWLLLWPVAQAMTYNGGSSSSSGVVARARMLHVMVGGYHVASVLGIAAMCALQQRHLMVWAVFAPKLVFEVAGLAAHGISLGVVHALLAGSSARF